MQALQNILKFLNTTATTPKYFGVFHIIWIAIAIISSVVLCVLWKKQTIKNVNKFVLIVSLILLILNLYKQVVLSFTYAPTVTFLYDWNNFPWQFVSIPLIVGLFIGATSGSINKHFVSYFATFGLVAGLYGLFQPNAFVPTVGLNVYSMLCSSLVVALAVLILYSKQVRIELNTFFKSLPVFAMVLGIAISFNEITHLFSSQAVNMFSIGRYSCSNVPVYSYLHNSFLSSGNQITVVEYIICILFYFIFVSLCALLPLALMIGIKKLLTVDFDIEYEKDDDLALGLRKSEGLDDVDSQEIFKFKGKVNSKKNTYMQTYFKNLNTNFGNNNKGSCGYVAASMLLSYYDTVLNEKIVPRQFDNPSLAHDKPDFSESPGVKFYQPSYNPDEISYKDYVKDINKRKSTYLHECLISLAIEKNLTDTPKDKNSNEFLLSTSVENIKKVLKRYFKKVAYIKSSEYDIHLQDNGSEIMSAKTINELTELSNDIRKYVIRKVKKGFPVLLGIHNGEDAHVVIAYDYDKNTDKLYCHFGWASDSRLNNSTHMTPEDAGYSIYCSALVLEFDERKISRTHTDNYEVVINGALFYYCLDGRYTTPDDLVVEFGVGKHELSIIGVYGKYPKEKLTIPESFGNILVSAIGNSALANQRHLQQVNVSCEIPSIPKKMFKDCESLKTVILPASIKKIGRKAFFECRTLSTIMFLGTKQEWYEIKKRGGWDRKTGNYRVYCVDGVLTKPLANEQSELL